MLECYLPLVAIALSLTLSDAGMICIHNAACFGLLVIFEIKLLRNRTQEGEGMCWVGQ